jgi:hypothetical protein
MEPHIQYAKEILIPEPVRHLLAGKSFVFADSGIANLKDFEDAVRLYEVRWREYAARRYADLVSYVDVAAARSSGRTSILGQGSLTGSRPYGT